jgi:hypothetical protein
MRVDTVDGPIKVDVLTRVVTMFSPTGAQFALDSRLIVAESEVT